MKSRYEQFASSISAIYHAIQRIERNEMIRFGSRGVYAQYLAALHSCPEGLTAARFSELCDRDKAAVSRAVSRLEDAEFITLGDAPYKKRYRCKILLTEEGQIAAESVYNAIKTAVTAGGEGLTDEERAVFYKALSIIEKNLNELY